VSLLESGRQPLTDWLLRKVVSVVKEDAFARHTLTEVERAWLRTNRFQRSRTLESPD